MGAVKIRPADSAFSKCVRERATCLKEILR